MAVSKAEILANLDPTLPTRNSLLERGRQYLGRDVPEQYFIIQDWCAAQGSSRSQDSIPDFSYILQGVEYFVQAATGKYPDEDVLSQVVIENTLTYLERREYFEGGVLHTFPEFQNLFKQQLLTLPKGRQVLQAIKAVPGYQDLF